MSFRCRGNETANASQRRGKQFHGVGVAAARVTVVLRRKQVSPRSADVLQQRFHHDDCQTMRAVIFVRCTIDQGRFNIHQTEWRTMQRVSQIRVHNFAQLGLVWEESRHGKRVSKISHENIHYVYTKIYNVNFYLSFRSFFFFFSFIRTIESRRR